MRSVYQHQTVRRLGIPLHLVRVVLYAVRLIYLNFSVFLVIVLIDILVLIADK